MPRIAKSFLLIIVVIGLLGGCSGVNKEDKEVIDRSESIAIKYLKDTYNLNDVVITRRQLQPRMAMARVTVYGYVRGHEEQHFNVSVNYESNKAELLSFSREFRNMLSERGFDPYK